MSYRAAAVANSLLEMAWSENKTISPMKIQKLVYFAHGWHWALTNKPLIDERVQAWTYGPVIPSLYHGFKEYGTSSITDLLSASMPEPAGRKISLGYPKVPSGDQYVTALLDRIWEVYGPLTAIQLSNMTHAENGPWKTALTKRSPGERGVEIPPQEIKSYFSSRLIQGT